ncbi:hypothetical protein EUZ85_01270 [Hahella sp. KA22]|uniref:hypothetical protein n=1 Tax=Hahella sp. KA22 TaxID=1628392 RepID=UPI000FDD1F36|nr:hypothetical protein [Hahella sp. KA22]AZZ95124.1 hypothetical protein ENC22_29560 [Hahella sp. KA22]QAY52769.1 hypothetical protein EUZ85_01270 [Hahella sp. KA22]
MQESNIPEHHQLIPLENPTNGWGPRQNTTGKRLFITKEANIFLRNLNTYQQTEVYRAISKLVSDGGYGQASSGFKLKPMFMRSKTDGIAAAGNLNLVYSVNSDKIIISSIGINEKVVGSRRFRWQEKPGLYEIPRVSNTRYHEHSDSADILALPRSWGGPTPVVEVKTDHAAVNGMLNDLEKATWLMGVHLDTAYWDDQFQDYTLFHNPSQGVVLDLFECMKDKIGSSKVCDQLVAVLLDCQRKGRKIKWVCHSQGGIIFTRAVEKINNMGIRLDGQQVAVHSGGNNKDRAKEAFAQAGINVVDMDRDSPFDLVPNLAGNNDWSWSTTKRCLRFSLYVFGIGDRPMQTSPHTLPYLSQECSIRHLQLCGRDRAAARVIKEQSRLSGC